jgi:cytochrome P450
MTSGVEMRAYVDDLIKERKEAINNSYGEPDTSDDVLSRLLRMQTSPDASFNDARTRDNIIGTILGSVDTTSKAIAYAVDELLRRPQQLAEARAAALSDNDDALTHYVFEALRFKPQSAALLRLCEKPYTLAKGTGRDTAIKPGTLIFAAASSAMFDPAYIEAPEEFRNDRDLDLDYLHFGYGRHMCFGRFISRLQIVGVIKELLRAGELQRIPGAEGEIKQDGPFPDSLVVEIKRDTQ